MTQLDRYRAKRDFTTTPEPSGEPAETDLGEWGRLPAGRRFCVQRHRATRMHWDLRLEHNGVLLSWAVPLGPTLDPAQKRMAIRTEDHPLDYGWFEGVIPSGYGRGTVELWDMGTFEWVKQTVTDPDAALAIGDVKFVLAGHKLHGEFVLARVRPRPGSGQDPDTSWLLIKKRDEAAVSGYTAAADDGSVRSGKSLDQIAAAAGGDPRRRAPAPPLPTHQLPHPMLATSAARPFDGEGWLFELKYDGVRCIIGADGDAVVVRGRSGRDETDRYPELQHALRQLSAQSVVLDGEIVALNDQGRPDFERLQQRINAGSVRAVARAAAAVPVHVAVFDILELDGRDLTNTALRIRKKTLRDILSDGGVLFYADHVEEQGIALFDQVRQQGLEGVVAKRGASLYLPGRRSRDWIKVKAWRSQSCAVVGLTRGHGSRRSLGALVLGVVRDGRLVHAGQAGSGLSEAAISDVLRRCRRVDEAPVALAAAPPSVAWVAPALVVEVRHAGWTRQGVLRHPVVERLRPDLDVADCTADDADAGPPTTKKPRS